MVPYTLIVISLLLDGISSCFLPYLPNNLSLLTPMLTVVTLFLIYPFYRKQEKKYFLIVFITGLIYDLLYTNLLFFNATLFLIIGIVSKYIYKNYEPNYLNLIIQIVLIITIYELITTLIIIVFNLVPITLTKVLYKISHSLILNILYSEILFLIIAKMPKSYKKININ